ncbi:MAG: GumC family protein, partial [Verrucomicrobiales bacterium]
RQTVRWMVECEPQTMLAIDSEGWRSVPMSVSPKIGDYRPNHRLLGSYEAINPVNALTLSLKGLSRIVPRSTVIDQAVLQTVITGGAGGLRHQATFQISHAQPENLLLALPDSCEIWSLKVNDILTKPVRHAESDLQVRLPAPGETRTTVSLVYQTPSSASLTLAPQVLGDIPTLRSTRHLLGPGKISIKVAEAPDPLALFPALFRAATSEDSASAETTLQINRELHDWKIFHGETPSGRAYVPPTFIETERKVMLSKNMLVRVVNVLQLESKWNLSRSDAIKRVRSSLEVSAESGTDLIRIRSKQKDPAEAAKIVNALAKAYLEYRLELERVRSNGALDTLQKQLKNQSDKVEETRLRMLDFAERYRIIDLAAMQNRASHTGDPVTGVGSILMSSMQDTYKAESALVQIKMQIENLSGLEGERLIQSAAMLDINDPTLQSLWPTYQKAQLDKQGLLDAGLGPNHPKLRQIDGKLVKTKEMLAAAVEGVRNTLKTKMDMASQALVLSKEMEEGKKNDSMDERRKVAEYSETSKEYALQRNMLANMQAKFATEQVDLTMPNTPITIHEEASVTPNQAQGILPLEIDLPDLTPKLTQTQFGELPALSFQLESAEDQTRRAWLGIACGALLFIGLNRGPKWHPWVWLILLSVLLGFLTPYFLPNATTLANALLLGTLIIAPCNLLRKHA